jgi:hypothetical protein
MKASTPPAGRHGSRSSSGTMIKTVLGASAVLLITLLGGWIWGAGGNADIGREIRASELRDDLLQAHLSLLGALVDVYEYRFRSASRRLEDARGLLRQARERGTLLGWRAGVTRLDLDYFEAEIDTAQRLLGQLDPGANALVPQGQGIVDGAPKGSTFLRR